MERPSVRRPCQLSTVMVPGQHGGVQRQTRILWLLRSLRKATVYLLCHRTSRRPFGTPLSVSGKRTGSHRMSTTITKTTIRPRTTLLIRPCSIPWFFPPSHRYALCFIRLTPRSAEIILAFPSGVDAGSACSAERIAARFHRCRAHHSRSNPGARERDCRLGRTR